MVTYKTSSDYQHTMQLHSMRLATKLEKYIARRIVTLVLGMTILVLHGQTAFFLLYWIGERSFLGPFSPRPNTKGKKSNLAT